MTLSPSTDSYAGRSQIQVSLDNALMHAAAGYPVLPISLEKVMLGDYKSGRTSEAGVRQMWSRLPDANVGVWLTGSGIVVIDVDGPEGEKSLARLLDRCRTILPLTYIVHTRRGRHLYLRLPHGRPGLVTQYGHDHHRPELDIKFTGMIVAAGSLFRGGSGRCRGNLEHPPRVDSLPLMPTPLYDLLYESGRPYAASMRRRRAAKSEVTTPEPTVQALDGDFVAPEHVRALLADTTHGRDHRIFGCVLRLIRAGFNDEVITNMILNSMIGSRASKNGQDPHRYVANKISDAHRYVDEPFDPGWDAYAFRQAIHRSALGPSQTRILDHLLDLGAAKGVVACSTGRIALDCALSEGATSDAIKCLLSNELLCVLSEYDPKAMTPRTFGLVGPWNRQIPGGNDHAPPPPPPHPLISVYPRHMQFLLNHDAFRPLSKTNVRTLHTAYPVLALLGDRPVSTNDLVSFSGMSTERVQRALRLLREAGIVVRSRGAHRRIETPLQPLLGRWAEKCGTAGDGARARLEYFRQAEAARQHRLDMAVPGTEAWKSAKLKTYVRLQSHPNLATVVSEGLERGLTRIDLAEADMARELAHIEGDDSVVLGDLD